jgi:hypothetical protein
MVKDADWWLGYQPQSSGTATKPTARPMILKSLSPYRCLACVLSCVTVAIDGVWIGNRIYWLLTARNNK